MSKFKAKNMSKLDSPERRKMLPTDKALKLIGIQQGMKVADVGCGTGYFSLPMAEIVGEEGKIFAIDISTQMLQETKRRVEEAGHSNVEIVSSGENNFKIKDKSADMVFTSTVFHEVSHPEDFLTECKRIMKDEGSIIILDWNKIESEVGPPVHIRISVETLETYGKKVGLKTQSVAYFGRNFYIVKMILN
ncbi:class I SAM-dependent methyltransferase [Clostridium sediminicola]|uniref:class I SAM-dependent methyltransferase n=1 Tax=Clostridium sediminicola TaxID=3114879 RepID=UPI0031F204A8